MTDVGIYDAAVIYGAVAREARSPDERVSTKSGAADQSGTIHPGFRFAHPGYTHFCDVIYESKDIYDVGKGPPAH